MNPIMQYYHQSIRIMQFAWGHAIKNVKLRRICFYAFIFLTLTIATFRIAQIVVDGLGNLLGRPTNNLFQFSLGSSYTYLVQAPFILWVPAAFTIAGMIAIFFFIHFFVKGWIGSLVIAASEEIHKGNVPSIANINPSALKYWGPMVIMDWLYLILYCGVGVTIFILYWVITLLFGSELIGFGLIIILIPIVLFVLGIVSLTQIFAKRFILIYNLSLFKGIQKGIEIVDKHFTPVLVLAFINGIIYIGCMLFFIAISLLLPLGTFYLIFHTTVFSVLIQTDATYELVIIFSAIEILVIVNAGAALLRNVYEIAATEFFHDIYPENHPAS